MERIVRTRRSLIRSIARAAGVFTCAQILDSLPPGVGFIDVASKAGLNQKTVFGGEKKNKYLLETAGCGAAFFDFDNDGWLDIFLVNGTRFEATYPAGRAPTCRLYKNNRDGTFTDVTARSGLARTGWGQGVCAGDYNDDGHEDLFVTYWGNCSLFRNNGDGTFTDVSREGRRHDSDHNGPETLEHRLRVRRLRSRRPSGPVRR